MNQMLFSLNAEAIRDEKSKDGFVPGRIDSTLMPVDIYDGSMYHIRGKYAVAHSPANLEHFGGKGCCITVISGNGINGLMPLPLLITDEYFAHLSTNAQRYLICHEFGHLVNGHLDDIIKAVREGRIIKFAPVRSFREECEADMNAVRLLGKDNTLAAMRECIAIFEDVANVKEMGERAEYVKYNAR